MCTYIKCIKWYEGKKDLIKRKKKEEKRDRIQYMFLKVFWTNFVWTNIGFVWVRRESDELLLNCTLEKRAENTTTWIDCHTLLMLTNTCSHSH